MKCIVIFTAVLLFVYSGLVLTESQGEPIPFLRPYHGEPTVMVQTLVRQSDRERLINTLRSVPSNGVIMATGQCPDGWVTYTDENGSPLTFDGLPLDQASDADQLRVSCAIAMRSDQDLKVIRIRDGSLLEPPDKSLGVLAEMAREHDYQVWMERVDSSGTVGFVIEEGRLKEKD